MLSGRLLLNVTVEVPFILIPELSALAFTVIVILPSPVEA
jgi:hypothetical protein